MLCANLHPEAMLAFFQATQLNLFERFLTQARSGIDSTGITAGMQNVAYVVLLVGFLWQVYQSALHGGDVRGLGTNLIKYVVTAVLVMNYGTVFTTINQGFVNAGNWVNSASGYVDLFQNWSADLRTQFNQVGFQKMWGLISGDLPGLLDAILILVAYLLYPIVIVVFGFFYIFYGSILYIFGPIVIALMPLGGANRLAKSYVENIFIWNAWPVLYGGFGALLIAVQMGQLGQMLAQNNFLGGLGNLEGSFLIGIVSIVYSLAIAVIPFVAKRIVSGDVGSRIVQREEEVKQQLKDAQVQWEAVRLSEDKEQRRSAVLARNRAQATLWEHEQDARDQFSSLHLFIHYWAQGKQENRRAWAQAMNAVVTGGTGSGAVLFQSFPQEVVDAFAEVTGGQRVRVRMPKTVNGYAWFDDERRAFLVERIANPEGPECEKRVFLFQYKGKRNLLFENTSAPIPLGHS